jgi:hypothetical protein
MHARVQRRGVLRVATTHALDRLERRLHLAVDSELGPEAQPVGTPVLNSRPASAVDVYLDFGPNPGVDAFDLDGNPGSVNAAEAELITEFWRQVAAYLSPLDVNVTTVFTLARPKAWVSINNTTGNAYNVSGFPNASPSSFASGGDARWRVAGVVHEIGHNFGVGHQADYNYRGEVQNGYAEPRSPRQGAIMGVDFGGWVAKWRLGHAGSADTVQDDLAILAASIIPFQGGDGFIPDDHTNGTAASATLMTSVPGGFSATGVIERLGDADLFRAVIPTAGQWQVHVTPDWPSQAALRLEQYNQIGGILTLAASSELPTSNGQTMTLQLNSGTRYFRVRSMGNYADLGGYALRVSKASPGWINSTIGDGASGYSHLVSEAVPQYTQMAGIGSFGTSTTDTLFYSHRVLNLNGSITARVDNFDFGIGSGRAALMLRDSLSANSSYAAITVSKVGVVQAFFRTAEGGNAYAASSVQVPTSGPVWLRLARDTGSVFVSYSTNGVNFSFLDGAALSMDARTLLGTTVVSDERVRGGSARFNDVQLTGPLDDPTETRVTDSFLPPVLSLANAATGSGVQLSWTNTGYSNYRVERSLDSTDWTNVATVNGTAYADTPPVGGSRWWYRVRPITPGGVPVATAGTASIIVRPAAPVVSIINPSTTSNVIDWTDVTGESGYRIEWSFSPLVAFSTLATVGANQISYTHAGLTAGSQHVYRVVPIGGDSIDGTPSASLVTRTRSSAATTNLRVTARNNGSVSLAWDAVPGSNVSYLVERGTTALDAFSGDRVVVGSTSLTTFTDASAPALSDAYYFVYPVFVTQSVGQAASVAASVPSTPLPAPWVHTDIGSQLAPGTSGFVSSSLHLVTGGAGLDGTADGLSFTHTSMGGDGEVTVHVDWFDTGDTLPQTGLMLRENLSPGSRYFGVLRSQGNVARLQYRSATNGPTTIIAIPGQSAAGWLRIRKTGSTLEAFVSPDGAAWTSVGSTSMTGLPSGFRIGVASCYGNPNALFSSIVSGLELVASTPVLVATGFDRDVGLPQEFTFEFNEAVYDPQSSSPLQFTLQNVTTGATLPANAVTFTQTPNLRGFRVRATTNLPNRIFPDGRYRFTLQAGELSDLTDNPLLEPVSFEFRVLAGDATGDFAVNFDDLLVLAASYNTSGRSFSQGDFTYDQKIDFSDLLILASRYNTSVLTLVAPPPVRVPLGGPDQEDDAEAPTGVL